MTFNMHLELSLFSPRGGVANYHGILDNLKTLGSNFPSLDKYVVSKITWTGHHICYIIQFKEFKEIPSEVSNFPPTARGLSQLKVLYLIQTC